MAIESTGEPVFVSGPAGPASAATAAALTDVQAALKAVLTSADLPAARTSLGLGNVANMAPADLPVSSATAAALASLAGLVSANQTALSTVLAGANPAVDTFIEAYNRFLADESAAAAMLASINALQAALTAEVSRAQAAEQVNATAIGSNVTAITGEVNRAMAAEGLLAPKARQLATPGAGGLQGGGDLSADRTLSIASNGVTNAMLAQAAAGTLKANLLGSTASLTDATFAAVLDAALGNTRGAVAYRGAAGWTPLAPGTAGQYLGTGGAGADPSWGTPSGAGNVSTSGGPTAGQIALFVSGTSIKGIAAPSFRSRLINGNFAINQRAAASASTAYAAGAYVMDRWKAGSGGCTLSFATAANGDVTVTVTAGTLVQVIEGSLYLQEGGAYVLSWIGTAAARAYQGTATGSYVASPLAVTGLTAGTNATVEISTGTIGLAQIEAGAIATAFERRDDELRRCMRYAQVHIGPVMAGVMGSSSFIGTMGFVMPVQMRAAPSVVIGGSGLYFSDGYGTGSFSSISANNSTASSVNININTNAYSGQGRPVMAGGSSYTVSLYSEL